MTEVRLDPSDPEQYFLLGSQLPETKRFDLLDFLLQNKEVFAWTPYEMPGIDPEITCHKLNVDPKHKPMVQKARKTGVTQTEVVRPRP